TSGSFPRIEEKDLPKVGAITDAIKRADEHVYSQLSDPKAYASSLVQNIIGPDSKNGGWGMASTFYMKIAFANQRVRDMVLGANPQPSVTEAGSAASETPEGQPSRAWAWLGSWVSNDSNATLNSLRSRDEQVKQVEKALSYANVQYNEKIARSTVSRVSNSSAMTAFKFGESWPSNKFFDAIKEFFGVNEFNALIDPEQRDVFPMVKLANIGSAFIRKAAEAFGVGLAASIVSTSLGNVVFMIGFLGLGIGFLLYYVLPFMPFMYFFFAIVEWGMGVLEAMVGAPLWALAHLRIDGEGMPGQAAMQGYNIMLGILLRPFFILFGLLASYICFNSGAAMLNIVFAGPVGIRENGFNTMSGFSFVGYLIIYAIIVYNLGLVCFKMIDQIPNQVLRWMGISDGTYKDGKPDPIGNVSQMAMGAGAFVGGSLANAASGAAGAIIGAPAKGIAKGGIGAIRKKGKASGKTS
ncbi:MAG: DotA/TraY family protein, partial [Alphaproteobacteria bacterium]|nr:DotA/TraY family protein [Alphaproteobacteria bacterium]